MFIYKDKRFFLQLYKQFVRCHLEFAIPAWSPWLAGDIEVLEKVQKRAVNIITGLHSTTYEEKLKELNLRTLAERRNRIDMVETFKILKGFSNVKSSTWFNVVDPNIHRMTRSTEYPLNIVGSISNTDIRRNFFSNRIVNTWNGLPNSIKDSTTTVKMFKSRLDQINRYLIISVPG